MAYLGLEPDGVRVLADRLAMTASRAHDLAVAIERAVFDSGLTSLTPASMHDLAGGLEQTSALLHVARSLTTGAPVCALGPTTVVGSSSPCDPVESVKVYTLSADGFVPVIAALGVKFDTGYVIRVEHLKSGRLRVTRIDEAALGVGWAVGQNAEIDAGTRTLGSGASTKAWLEVLMARGTTYEIEASDLDEFVMNDLLDHVEQVIDVMSGFAAGGLFKPIAKVVVGIVDQLPSWKLHGVISGLRKRLNWKKPAALSNYVEAGVVGGVKGGAGSTFAKLIPIQAKAGISLEGRFVGGIEYRRVETTYYLDVRAECAAPLAARLFNIDLSKFVGVEIKIGLVLNTETDTYDRIDVTVVTDTGKAVARHTAMIDLTDLATHSDALRLLDSFSDPTLIGEAVDAIQRLSGHQVNVEEATFQRKTPTVHGIEVANNAVKFTVEELDAR